MAWCCPLVAEASGVIIPNWNFLPRLAQVRVSAIRSESIRSKPISGAHFSANKLFPAQFLSHFLPVQGHTPFQSQAINPVGLSICLLLLVGPLFLRAVPKTDSRGRLLDSSEQEEKMRREDGVLQKGVWFLDPLLRAFASVFL